MKYPDDSYARGLMKHLPGFMLLITFRDIQKVIELSEIEAPLIIQMVEAFLFTLINIADPEVMENGLKEPKDYITRRAALLEALGLEDYAKKAMLVNPKDLGPKFDNPN